MLRQKKKKKIGKARGKHLFTFFHNLNSVGSFFLIKLRCLLNGLLNSVLDQIPTGAKVSLKSGFISIQTANIVCFSATFRKYSVRFILATDTNFSY